MRISDWSSDVCSSDLALVGVRMRQYRVKRHHQRGGHPVQQLENHPARRTAEDSILMLEPDDIRAAVVDLLCGCEIIGDFVLPDHPRHLRRIVAPLAQVIHRIDVDVNPPKTPETRKSVASGKN